MKKLGNAKTSNMSTTLNGIELSPEFQEKIQEMSAIMSGVKLEGLDREATSERLETAPIIEYISTLTARDIATMKYNRYNGIVTELIKAIMSESGENRMSASEKALNIMKTRLHPQLVKITNDRDLLNNMNYSIYRELDLDNLF